MSWRRMKRRWRRRVNRVPAWAIGIFVIAVLVAATWAAAVALEPAPVVSDPGSAPRAGADEGCGVAALRRSARLITETPAQARVAILGDSTRDEAAAAGPFMAQVRSNLSLVPARNIVSFGENGAPLEAYLTLPVQQRLQEFDPNVIEMSIGINDLRLDQTRARVNRFRADLSSYVAELHQRFPKATIVLSVPGALSTRDVNGAHYVTDVAGVVNAPGAAQAATTALRETYLRVTEEQPFVVLNDVQGQVTGTDADRSQPPRYLFDQLHPSPTTQEQVADLVTTLLLDDCAAN